MASQSKQVERNEQPGDGSGVKKKLVEGTELDKRQIGPAVIQDHHLMDHGQLEMGCRVIYRNPRVFSQQHHEQGDHDQQQQCSGLGGKADGAAPVKKSAKLREPLMR